MAVQISILYNIYSIDVSAYHDTFWKNPLSPEASTYAAGVCGAVRYHTHNKYSSRIKKTSLLTLGVGRPVCCGGTRHNNNNNIYIFGAL